METQKYTREGLIHLCKTQPEAAADLILLLLDRVDKLEARVIELENALNKNSQNRCGSGCRRIQRQVEREN